MKNRHIACLLAASLLAFAGAARADLSIQGFERFNWVLITSCDEDLVLANEHERGLEYGEFASDLALSGEYDLSAIQQSLVTVAGDELHLSGSASCGIDRVDAGGCEVAQAQSLIWIEFTPAVDSVLDIDNRDFQGQGEASGPWLMVTDLSTEHHDIIYSHSEGDDLTSIPLVVGHRYRVDFNVICRASGSLPTERSASATVGLVVRPAGSTAVAMSTWSRMKELFDH